jgi:hypothetical protein
MGFMALEKNLTAVPPVLITVNSTDEGVLTIANTCGFYVKQDCLLAQAGNTNPIAVQIKRVVDGNVLWVGPKGSSMLHNIDVSAYTVASGAYIQASEQPKAVLPMETRLQASYMQEPSNSWRVTPVDCIGNLYDANNPLPVAFDGTVSIGDVSIVEGGNTLKVNADGSINVVVEDIPLPGHTVKNIYNEANSVASGATTTLVSYTVPGGITNSILERISVSGENIAKFTVFWNAAQIDTRRTFYGSSLSEYFEFTTGSSEGFLLSPGDTIVVRVLHNRPYVGDFEGRIQVLEIT